jgi:hypothetical protein
MTRQESRLLWLRDGDAPTRFFHAHANIHHRKNHIHSLVQCDRVLVTESDKVDVATLATRSNTIRLDLLDLPCVDLHELCTHFTKEEVWAAIRDLPSDKVSGPDGFTAWFLQVT